MKTSTASAPRGARGFVRSAPRGTVGQCSAGEHVDVITGRVSTRASADIAPPHEGSPLPPFLSASASPGEVLRLSLSRVYSSAMAERNVGLGHGWAHTWGWSLDVEEDAIVVWTDEGIAVDFPRIDVGERVIGAWGYGLRRTEDGYWVEPTDGLQRRLVAADASGKRYRLGAIVDRNGNRITLRYEGERLCEVRGPWGDVVSVTCTEQGEISSLAQLGELIGSYAYDEHRDLLCAVDAAKAVSVYKYEEHLLVQHVDRAGLTRFYRYDDEGRCVETWGRAAEGSFGVVSGAPSLADGTLSQGLGHVRVRYEDGGWSEVTDAISVRRFKGNTHGLMEARVEGGGESSARYDARGLVLVQTNELGASTRTERDAAGNIVREEDAIGRARTIERDEEGRATHITEANGGVTEIHYEARGNVIRTIDPCGGVLVIERDERGFVVETTEASGARTSYVRDEAGRCVARRDPSGAVWEWTYDARGRCVSETSPLEVRTRFEHDERGDVCAIHERQSVCFERDKERRLTAVIDGMNRTTRFRWGHLDKLVQIIDPEGGTLRATYDRDGALDELINWLKPEERYAVPDARSVLIERDAAGQIIKRRLGEHGSEESFDYDARGDVVRATWPCGVITFERDAMGRVLRESQTIGGETIVIEHAFDAGGVIGRVSSLGLVEQIARRRTGKRARTIVDGAGTIEHEHNAIGLETARRLPEGGRICRSVDLLTGRCAVRWVLMSTDACTHHTSYEHDEGDVLGDVKSARSLRSIKRDAAGRVIAFGGERFDYDDAGNRHERTVTSRWSGEYGLEGRLVQSRNASYEWDDAGRLVLRSRAGEVDRFTWDELDRLRAVELADGRRIEYDYDPFGRRVRARTYVAGGLGEPHTLFEEARWVWDDTLVHERRARSGEPTTLITYVYEDDGVTPIAMSRAELDSEGNAHDALWSYFVNDAMGTPEVLVGADGAVQVELERRAWGRTSCDLTAAGVFPLLRFPGQVEDLDTGLHYHRFRYYDPDMGLYLSPDPSGYREGRRPYAYVSDPFEQAMPRGIAETAEGESHHVEAGWQTRRWGDRHGYTYRDDPVAGGARAYASTDALRWYARWLLVAGRARRA